MRTLILIFLHNENLKVQIEKVWKYGFIGLKSCANLSMSSSRRFSPGSHSNHCKKIDVFFLLVVVVDNYSPKENSHGVASKERLQTCCLKPFKSMIFPPLPSF